MNQETYDYIWDEVIYNKIKQLYDSFPNHVTTKYRPDSFEKLKDTIYKKYYLEKERLKELYHCGGDDEQLIDIHKIAACFTKVLLEENIFHISLDEEISDDVFLINAKLAYSVGLGLIRINLIFFYLEMGKEDLVKRLLDSEELQVPPTNNGHDEYNLGREKTLTLNKIFGNEFDILTYSDMLFWIEYYNRQFLEGELSPTPFPKEIRICEL